VTSGAKCAQNRKDNFALIWPSRKEQELPDGQKLVDVKGEDKKYGVSEEFVKKWKKRM